MSYFSIASLQRIIIILELFLFLEFCGIEYSKWNYRKIIKIEIRKNFKYFFYYNFIILLLYFVIYIYVLIIEHILYNELSIIIRKSFNKI